MKSFRNIPRIHVAEVGAIGVADVIGAASLVVSESALDDARRRGSADGRAHRPHPPGDLGEELRADRRGQVHLPGRRPRPQDPDRPGGRGGLRGRGRRGAHRQGARQAEAPRPAPAAAPGPGRRRSSSSPRASGSSCSRARRPRRETRDAEPQNQTDQPRAPLRDLPAARAADRRRAGAEADRGPAQVRRPQRQRPRHRPPPRRRRQAALPQDRLQAPQGRRAGEGRDDRVRPQPQLLHRPAALRRRRTRTTSSPRPQLAVGDEVQSGPGADISPGNALALRRDADRHDRPQRRADPRPGRQARPRRRHRDPAGREGGRHGHPAAAVLGDAAGPRRVPRDRRHPLQRRAPEHQDRQGRPQPPQGQAPADAAASR